jgi:hypothetical protein
MNFEASCFMRALSPNSGSSTAAVCTAPITVPSLGATL